MKVRMLKNTKGSPNGIIVKNYLSGEVYDIPESLMKCFIEQGVVELAEPKEFPEIENKIEEVSETKKRGRKKNEL